MTIPVYSTGRVSVAAGGTVVTASGGPLWLANVQAGDWISIDLEPVVMVLGVAADNAISILPWPYGDKTNAVYAIVENYSERDDGVAIAKAVAKLVAAQDKEGFIWFVGPDETEPDPSRGDEGQYGYQPSTGKQWVKIDGLWVYQGIYGALSVTTTTWTTDTTYALNTIVPFQGKLWISLQNTNVGHLPTTSPLWWSQFLAGGDAYDIPTFDTDRPADNESVMVITFTKTVTFYAGLTDSRARANVGATNTAVYRYFKNGTQFATLTFEAGGQAGPQSGTFAAAADTVFLPGDFIELLAPTTRDPTLSGISSTLSGYRS